VKIKLFFFSIIPLFVSGCLNYIQDINLYPDGSGKMVITYWMNSPDDESLKVIDRIGIFNPDSIRKEFSSNHSEIENIEVFSDTIQRTIHAKIHLSFSHIDSLNDTKAFSEANFSLKDGAAGQRIFSQFIPPIATGFGIDGSNFSVTYKYTFYGEIIAHNAHLVESRTLSWIYTLSEIGSGKTVSVTFIPYKLKETPYWIYVISGLVLLIVLIFLFRKKKG
jgi:hypothetical protein